MSTPAHTMLNIQQFLTKHSMNPVPHPPYSPDLTPSDFFFVSPDEKSPQRETFCWCGGGETKNAEALKGVKIEFKQNRVKKLFWAVEKTILIGVWHQKESTLKVTEV